MHPQFPFKTKYNITQRFYDTDPRYVTAGNPKGEHRALDILPMDDENRVYPADIYPTLPGDEISIMDTSVSRGKGVRVRTLLDEPFIAYLRDKGFAVNSPYLEHLYWHCLEITNKDGKVDQQTPIAKAGNTGWVFANGNAVADIFKGVPPYPGLHLHFECSLDGQLIDPEIILNYKGDEMKTFVVTEVVNGENKRAGIAYDNGFNTVIEWDVDMPHLQDRAKQVGVDLSKPGQKLIS